MGIIDRIFKKAKIDEPVKSTVIPGDEINYSRMNERNNPVVFSSHLYPKMTLGFSTSGESYSNGDSFEFVYDLQIQDPFLPRCRYCGTRNAGVICTQCGAPI